ncbi:hypothetical protein DNTS_031539, partial [Danionella cerebrum]
TSPYETNVFLIRENHVEECQTTMEKSLLVWTIIIRTALIRGFNLNLNQPTVFSGPEDSYFGFSVDFYQSGSKSVVIGAPRANTRQPGVSRGGSVFICPWTVAGEGCQPLHFDDKGDENITLGKMLLLGHKSNQWHGASVRTHNNYILACAPLFHWNVLVDEEEAMNTPVGNCQLLNMQTGELAHYAPCREEYVEAIYRRGYPDRRYCEAGFTTDISKNGRVVLGAPGGFYFQGQVIAASLPNIMSSGRYSVAVGQFNNDDIPDYVVGVPNDLHTAGSISSYYGHSVAVTDINSDGFDDVLIGAPLFMERLSTQKFREVGQVYVYLQNNGFSFSSRPHQTLTGVSTYGRFGSAIAPLGDIDHDGFSDVAVGAPGSGGEGQVFIYLGQGDGLSRRYTQVIESQFHRQKYPSMFGFSIRGGTDVDDNGYPDVIIGAWGANKVVSYRAQAVVRTWARLAFTPDLLNPKDKFCQLPQSSTSITCFIIMACISASGYRIPEKIVLNTELQLDRMKQSMTRRTLLLESNQPSTSFQLVVESNPGEVCRNFTAYLLPEFKDKLSPIFISVNYSLADFQSAVLHGQSAAVGQTRIILNCGADHICIPDLKLKAIAATEPILIGDDNPALLIIEAENQGEGAYETELYISPPEHTHYQGVLSNKEKKENGSVVVVCDLGNPMEAGQQLKAGLYFSMGGLEQVEKHITFQMQIRSKNSQNPDSNQVQLQVNVNALASLEMRGVSSPEDWVLPITKWESKEFPEDLDEIGPLIEHVYELRNLGPSPVNAKLTLEFPVTLNDSVLLYVFANASEELISCQTDYASIDPRGFMKRDSSNISARQSHPLHKRELTPNTDIEQQWQQTVHVCESPALQRDERAIVRIMSRLWVQTFLKNAYISYVLHSTAHYEVTNVPSIIQPDVLPRGTSETRTHIVWRRPDGQEEIPVWWIVVAVFAGLLLLAALSIIFWKVGFFKRNRPPTDDEDAEETQELRGNQN